MRRVAGVALVAAASAAASATWADGPSTVGEVVVVAPAPCRAAGAIPISGRAKSAC